MLVESFKAKHPLSAIPAGPANLVKNDSPIPVALSNKGFHSILNDWGANISSAKLAISEHIVSVDVSLSFNPVLMFSFVICFIFDFILSSIIFCDCLFILFFNPSLRASIKRVAKDFFASFLKLARADSFVPPDVNKSNAVEVPSNNISNALTKKVPGDSDILLDIVKYPPSGTSISICVCFEDDACSYVSIFPVIVSEIRK